MSGSTISPEELKRRGNELFKLCNYEEAEKYYTRAIEIEPNAILYANRSMANMSLDLNGAAISDAMKAIELDDKYPKAYYRLGCAYARLCKYKEASEAFKSVVKLVPSDKVSRSKYDSCIKELRQQAFAKAIETEQTKNIFEIIDYDSLVVDTTYQGPTFTDTITYEFIDQLIEYQKSGKVLHKKYLWMLLTKLYKQLRSEPTLLHISLPSESSTITICGDTHGQYYDTLNIFSLNGRPSSENSYLFNGDFVDRGSFSIENVILLFSYHLLNPTSLYLLRGNHEGINMNKMFGFEGETKAKYDEKSFRLFLEVFNSLPLAAVIENSVFVCHGGIPAKGDVRLDDIYAIDRFREIPDVGYMCELLWNDPSPAPGYSPNSRGVGFNFGPDLTAKFLETNNLKLLIRSHQMKQEGYEIEHDGKCVTIFSAPKYCDQGFNKGAYIVFNKTMIPQYKTFTSSPHPDVPAMTYAPNLYGYR